MVNSVAVIGAGVAGIQAALDLANHEILVHLIEREPSIGGHMAQLDKTFPTNDCAMCILSPKMAEVARHPMIQLHTCSSVEKIEGEVGDFTLTIRKKPRFIDESLCNGCGDCVQICPVEVYNRFDAGIGVRKAIYKPQPQSVPDLVIKDQEHCIECGLCYDVCARDAVLKEQKETEIQVHVASVIVAVGYTIFDACRKSQFGYLRFPDVITSLELERMLNASGPTGGEVRRLSSGSTPQSVVFIQCVGSRDISVDRPYCSCVCCMAAIKNAMLIKEKYPEAEVTICYQDIRAYGKGYEEYYRRAEQMGIRFLKGMPGGVEQDASGVTLQVENTETREVLTLHPELVVLSAGIDPAPDLPKIAESLGIPLEKTGFARAANDAMAPVTTIKPGIYIAGTVAAPRDIPDTVIMGEAAAMKAFRDVLAAEAKEL
ncbi:MAG: CoB--CoM heterodisulfide reductase iron-sulfur subunit A family protein [Methanomicrobiales archaeon]|nr:CoB--CoM heterodisulfide reductase iron-sulfur subunit A family protein [Methanomicrobiales archaeon]